MSKVQRFEDLTIFQMARDLCKDVYAITKDGEFHKDMRFVQQIHAATGSIMDNIAEGYERDGNKEFINFLYIAKGSCGEVPLMSVSLTRTRPRNYTLETWILKLETKSFDLSWDTI